jgi:hypothetical protein
MLRIADAIMLRIAYAIAWVLAIKAAARTFNLLPLIPLIAFCR